jgi:phage terminase small subunit
MAGVKGRSGGARPGAGRKKKPPVMLPDAPAQAAAPEGETPLQFLLRVQNSADVPLKERIVAARAAAQYVHPKMGEGAKKVAAKAAQGVAEEGRFGRRSPPKLVAVGK